MPYRFATQRLNYTDYASGKVFYNLPGHPAFPVRLVSEVFQRCLSYRGGASSDERLTLYDPCCGGAYHLAVLAYFHWDAIEQLIASDIEPAALAIAARNLSLLTLDGLAQRVNELSRLQASYEKESHAEALTSAAALQRILAAHLARHPLKTEVFQADALRPVEIQARFAHVKADLVITDLPYGRQTSWQTSTPGVGDDFIHHLLEGLLPVLSGRAVVAAAALKDQKIAHPAYEQAGKLKLGFRQITFLKPR